ncbi:MAG: glycosyltransferase [Elusimicrobiota bacterium]|jgi:GT2 family glycosyltransferase
MSSETSASPHLTFLIPTRNRREDLHRLFRSLAAQTRKPDHVIIIDGGEDHVQDFIQAYPNLPVSYLPVYPPGLTRQRNAGLANVPKETTLVGFLDDDLELTPNTTEEMLRFWSHAEPAIAGCSFHIVNNVPTEATVFRRVFGLAGGRGGRILPSGFNTILFPVVQDTPVEWLCGGATVWRAEVFRDHRYEERYRGHGHFDDLDFCLSLGKNCRFMMLSEARVIHHHHGFRKGKFMAFGISDVINRYRFVRKYRLSVPAFCWASLGQLIGTLLSGVLRLDRDRIAIGFGIVAGFGRILLNRTEDFNALDLK